MKRSEILFSIIRFVLEFLLVFGTFFLARNIRRVTDLIPSVHLPIQTISDTKLLSFALAWSVLWVAVFAFSGLYSVRIAERGIREYLRSIVAAFQWFLFFIAGIYLAHGYLYQTEIPRLIVFFTLVISTFAVLLERFFLNAVWRGVLSADANGRTTVVLLMKEEAPEILQALSMDPSFSPVGYSNVREVNGLDLPYIGDFNRLVRMIRKREVDEVFLIGSDFSADTLSKIFDFCRIYGVGYRYSANRFEVSKSNATVTFIHDIPFIEIRNIGLGPWGRVAKRTFDIVASGFLLVVLSPLLLLVAFLVYLQDHHSPFYSSIRVGRAGSNFRMYKFRSMVMDADAKKRELQSMNERKGGPLFKIENDPRITWLGRFLRKYDIDELPQLFNVLVGDMSLVGPRPHLPDEVALYQEHQMRVLALKPGITGMAQTHGRHKNTFDDEVRLDAFYIESWTLFLDFWILLKTVGVVLSRKGR